MSNAVAEVGRVIRVGRGWADVEINHTVRRVHTRADLLIRAGSYLKIVGERGIALMPSGDRHATDRLQ